MKKFTLFTGEEITVACACDVPKIEEQEETYCSYLDTTLLQGYTHMSKEERKRNEKCPICDIYYYVADVESREANLRAEVAPNRPNYSSLFLSF